MKAPTRWRDRPDAPPRLSRMLGALDGEPAPGARERSWRRIDEALAKSQGRARARRVLSFAAASAAVALAAWWVAPRAEAPTGAAPVAASSRSSAAAPASASSTAPSAPGSSGDVVAPRHVSLGDGEAARQEIAGFALTFTGPAEALLSEHREPAVELRRGTVEVSRSGTSEFAYVVVAAAPWRVEGTSFRATFSAERELSVSAATEPVRVASPEGTFHVAPGSEWPERRAARAPELAPTRESSRPTASRRPIAPEPIVPPRSTQGEAASTTPEIPRSAALGSISRIDPVEVAPRGAIGGVAAEAAEASATAADRWAQANAHVREGRYPDALRAFESLAADSNAGTFSELSQYEVGRVRARHLGDPHGAAEAFRTYQRRFPDGAVAAEAELGLIEAVAASGGAAEALERIARALDGADATRVAELRLLRAGILRERGDLSGALEDFAAAAASPGLRGEEATFWAAWCEQKLGRTEAARARLEAYLAAHPFGAFRERALKALGRR